ncbi:MAG TPA: cytochrome c oxidase assembly factor Coa1 family protein [Candidatus Binataceae bacterium]|nr:cytochrome c oxidase assembly factor Coa1 family protein [Candidatus Binataceae bacterium]
MLRSFSISPGLSGDARKAFEGWFVIFLMVVMLGELYMRSSTPAAVALQFAAHNAVVQDAVGNVEYVRLNWIGNIHYDGEEGWASFKVHVKGARAHGTVDVTLQRQHGAWNVASGRITTSQGRIVEIADGGEKIVSTAP